MTTPSGYGLGDSPPPVDLTKGDPASDVPFDPYRYGRPEHPVPPEYAPPGYIPIDNPPTDHPPRDYAAPTSEPAYPYGPAPYQNQPYQNPQYGHYGGYGPVPPANPYAQPKTGNGKAIAALVLGIASIVLCWTSFLDAVIVILAVVFGVLGLNDAKSPGRGGRGMAIAGLVCGVVGGLLAVLLTVWVFSAVNKCGGMNERTSLDFKQCVQDHL